jgi:hypothetical protein
LTIEDKFEIISIFDSAVKFNLFRSVSWLAREWTISEFWVRKLSRVSCSW